MNYPKISLRAARVNANMSQRVASQKLGICRESLIKYEVGKTIPPWDVVQRMADLYKFPIEYLSSECKST